MSEQPTVIQVNVPQPIQSAIVAGAAGPPGPEGKQGPQGPEGKSGPEGPKGAQGPSGTSFTWQGAWNSAHKYKVDDVVLEGGSCYIAVAESENVKPKTDVNAEGIGTHWNDMAIQGAQGPSGPEGKAGVEGKAGPEGKEGKEGPRGLEGPEGKTVRNGTGKPAEALGNNGDFYIDTAAEVIYGPKAAGKWPEPGTSLVGPAGPEGGGTGSWVSLESLSAKVEENPSTQTFRVRKEAGGAVVRFRGSVKSKTEELHSTDVIAILPAGYRPSATVYLQCGEGLGKGSNRIKIETAGHIVFEEKVTKETAMILDGLTFNLT